MRKIFLKRITEFLEFIYNGLKNPEAKTLVINSSAKLQKIIITQDGKKFAIWAMPLDD